MKRLSRRFKRHFNKPSKRVAIKSHRAWYWQAIAALILIALGYLLAYWQLTVAEGLHPPVVARPVLSDRELLGKVVFAERQLQVQKAAQENLARELAVVQEESIKLKENVAFYQSILEESAGSDRVRLNRVQIDKTEQTGRYRYLVVLSQQGSHSKPVAGNLQFKLLGVDGEGKPSSVPLKLAPDNAAQAAVKFRYYQRLEGGFALPEGLTAEAVEVSFLENGSKQPNISQQVKLPN